MRWLIPLLLTTTFVFVPAAQASPFIARDVEVLKKKHDGEPATRTQVSGCAAGVADERLLLTGGMISLPG